jgi:hypothetical protein
MLYFYLIPPGVFHKLILNGFSTFYYKCVIAQLSG